MFFSPFEFVAYKEFSEPSPPGGPTLPPSLRPVSQYTVQHVMHQQLRRHKNDGTGRYYESGLILALLYPKKIFSLNRVTGFIPMDDVLCMCIQANEPENNNVLYGGMVELVKTRNVSFHPVTYQTQRSTDYHPADVEPAVIISTDDTASGNQGYFMPIPKEITEATMGKDDYRKVRPLTYFFPSAVKVTDNPDSSWNKFLSGQQLNFPLGEFCGTTIPLDANLTRPPQGYRLSMGRMKFVISSLFPTDA